MVNAAITYSFLNWARAVVQESVAECIAPELIFDERDASIAQSIKESLAKSTGICVALSLPQLQQTNGNRADDTQYICSLCVGVIQNRALSTEIDGAAVAETLFRRFAGAEYNSGAYRPADVRADNLTHSTVGMKKAHEFIVYTTLTI